MLTTLPHRLLITLLNLLFPPLAVALLDNFDTDTLINSLLFLCGVFPSHIHGFYISCVYFSRRRKARRGQWPGGERAFVYSERVLSGGYGGWEGQRGKGQKRDKREKHRGKRK